LTTFPAIIVLFGIESKREKVRSEIAGLCDRFPIYRELETAGEQFSTASTGR
jgi:hypothetical protein